ncbi:MAG: ABC transporter substrate-binding protein [Dehalococcoidales bacterium]|nr:ABC transporter substrate-binding protein [Dehalococcoidales bacterium]
MKRVLGLTGVFILIIALVALPLVSACTTQSTPAPASTTQAPPATSQVQPVPTQTAPASTTPVAAAPKVLKIGLITSVSGPLAPGFKASYDAARPTQDLLNQLGGIMINGEKHDIEIVVADDKSSPQDAVAAVNMLLQDGIRFIIAPIFPPNSIAIAPITTQARAIMVHPASNDPTQFSSASPYYFDCNMLVYNAPVNQDYLIKNYPQVKKVAYLCPDDPGTTLSFDLCIQEGEKRGLTTVFAERFPTDIQDYYPIMTKLLAQKPDGIDYTGGSPQWGIGIINQARDLGFTGPIYSDLIMGCPNLFVENIKPEYLNDIFQAAWDVRSDKMSPEVRQLRQLVQKSGSDLIYDSTHPITGAMIIMEGIKAAQSLDTDKVKAAMEAMTSINTPFGPGTWQGKDLGSDINHMLKSDKVGMSHITNGKVSFEWVDR